MHVEKVSFKPTVNLELGFERTVIWGGKNHVPITIGSFLKRFFSFQDVSAAEKLSRGDPGARFAPLIVPIVYLTCASGCLTPPAVTLCRRSFGAISEARSPETESSVRALARCDR